MGQVAKQTTFIENSEAVNTQSLANYLPNGELFKAKNINGSNLRNLLKAFSVELGRAEAKLQELADEYYIEDTENLITQWERAVGIPDECFKIENETIETRRKQVIAKLALMNLTTTTDFVALADFFDIRLEILNARDHSNFFPMTFPILLFENEKEAYFTMIVHFFNISRPDNAFPLTFPFTFAENPANFILCLFEKLKPACVKIAVRYKGEI